MKITNENCVIFDMDGVLFDFSARHNAGERFWNEPSFFKHLPPLKKSIKAMQKTINAIGAENVFILTKAPTNGMAEKEKKESIKRLVPNFNLNNFQMVPLEQSKGDYINNYPKPKNKCILIEDSKKNAEEWRQLGGQPLLFNGGTKIRKEFKNHYEWDRTFKDHKRIIVTNNLLKCLKLG